MTLVLAVNQTFTRLLNIHVDKSRGELILIFTPKLTIAPYKPLPNQYHLSFYRPSTHTSSVFTSDNASVLSIVPALDALPNPSSLTTVTTQVSSPHSPVVDNTFITSLSVFCSLSARCTEPPRTGPCRASHSHWYYDPLNRKCNRFTYGGCDGNDNNFDVEESCKETCKGVTGTER